MNAVTNCPNCGAPMQPDKSTGALVCAHCGTLDEQPVLVRDIEVGAMSRQPCPVCATPLSHAHLDGNALLYCRHCKGMLIAMEAFVLVIEAARSREERTGVSLPRRQNPGHRTLTCPECERPMLNHFYSGPGNLVIDTVRALSCELAGSGGTASNRPGAARSPMDILSTAGEP